MDGLPAAVKRTTFSSALVRWLPAHPYTFVVIVFVLVMAIPFCARRTSEWDDVFVRAAAAMWDRRDMYDLEGGYAYPPFMAWLSIPFAFLPARVERLLYYAVNMVCLVLLCRWAWTLSGGMRLQDRATPKTEHIIFLLGLACAFRYVIDGLAHQQVDIIIGCLLLGGCVALSRSRYGLGATAFGLAAAMKCTALLWSPYLLWRRRWLEAAWLLIVAVGFNLLPCLVSSAPSGRPWASEWVWRYITPLGNAAPGAWHSDVVFNQSVSGLWNRYAVTRWQWTENAFVVPEPDRMSAPMLRGLVYGSELSLLAGALAVFGWWPQAKPTDLTGSRPSCQVLEFSIVLMLMLLLSPMSSKPHFCTLLLPAFCVARWGIEGRSRLKTVLLILAIITSALSIRGILGESLSVFGLWWGSITWSTLCLFLACWHNRCLQIVLPTRIPEVP